MKLRTCIAATALGALAVAAPAAHAQVEPIDGGTTIITPVYNTLELTIRPPQARFTTFAKAKTYTTSFEVAVTTTDLKAQLSLADGDVATGSKLGRLASGSKLLAEPLEARVGKTAFVPLDQTVAAPLAVLTGPISGQPTTVDLRQQVDAASKRSYRKLLLVTLSTETP